MSEELRPVIWARLSKQGRGPARTLSYERITDAAIELADEGGLEAVSMRKIATMLEHSAMSLYRHVGSKDDLTELMYDAALGELELSRTGAEDWRVAVARLARDNRRLWHRHPWISKLSQRPTLGPNANRMLEYALAAVDGIGLDMDQMWDVVATALQFTHGFVEEELAEAEVHRRTGMDIAAWQAHMAPFLRQLLEGGARPYLRRFVTETEESPDQDVVFERRLAMVLDGLAIMVASHQRT
ncbi:TetR/AcrR family transcriptional regulator [Parafrigoribacterium humi]|jgi:AcrR family transcriptional regulator|uniref:TetR/AcrR family transcriptional regulator n=1 Tax=Parafrigoribacterium humi TaxID=3144664 RepID=UPI0032EECC9C